MCEQRLFLQALLKPHRQRVNLSLRKMGTGMRAAPISLKYSSSHLCPQLVVSSHSVRSLMGAGLPWYFQVWKQDFLDASRSDTGQYLQRYFIPKQMLGATDASREILFMKTFQHTSPALSFPVQVVIPPLLSMLLWGFRNH